jgi:hypothetical protein
LEKEAKNFCSFRAGRLECLGPKTNKSLFASFSSEKEVLA